MGQNGTQVGKIGFQVGQNGTPNLVKHGKTIKKLGLKCQKVIKITEKVRKSKKKLKSMEIASLITKIRLKNVKQRGRPILKLTSCAKMFIFFNSVNCDLLFVPQRCI